jgi:hypothetical protein
MRATRALHGTHRRIFALSRRGMTVSMETLSSSLVFMVTGQDPERFCARGSGLPEHLAASRSRAEGGASSGTKPGDRPAAHSPYFLVS